MDFFENVQTFLFREEFFQIQKLNVRNDQINIVVHYVWIRVTSIIFGSLGSLLEFGFFSKKKRILKTWVPRALTSFTTQGHFATPNFESRVWKKIRKNMFFE